MACTFSGGIVTMAERSVAAEDNAMIGRKENAEMDLEKLQETTTCATKTAQPSSVVEGILMVGIGTTVAIPPYHIIIIPPKHNKTRSSTKNERCPRRAGVDVTYVRQRF